MSTACVSVLDWIRLQIIRSASAGEVTDDFIETKLTKMVKMMREFGTLDKSRERY